MNTNQSSQSPSSDNGKIVYVTNINYNFNIIVDCEALRDRNSMDAKLDKLIKMITKSHSQHAQADHKLDYILYEASGQNPVYEPKNATFFPGVKQKMVELAVAKLLKSDALSTRSVCNNILKRFKGTPGAYKNLNSFRRQVNRILGKSGTF